jgi:hypothetical protein
MWRYGEIDEVPPKFDDEGNPTNNEEGSKMVASNAPTLEDLTRRLETKSKNKRQEDKMKLLLKQRRRLLIQIGNLQKGEERKKKSR